MKIKRMLALTVIALLVVGAMGFVTARGLARSSTSHSAQVIVTQALDTDNLDEQVGDQNEADTGPDVEDSSKVQGTDTDNLNEQVGDQNGADAGSDVEDNSGVKGTQEQDSQGTDTEPDLAALQAQAKITIDQAQQAALNAMPGGTILKVELGDENGAPVYAVEFSGGTEVKVDAITGAVLGTESGGD
jgi:uncharacterized membrane protein YkoI